MNSEIKTELYCDQCGNETAHRIVYQNDKIHKIICEDCGHTVEINHDYVEKHFKEDFVHRVLSKPGRMTKEMQADLNGFLKSLPFRVVTKPYRMMKEREGNRQL